MGIIKKALQDVKPEIKVMKRSVAARTRRHATEAYGAAIDETLDADLHPAVKEALLDSLVQDRDNELERIRKQSK